MIYLNYATTHTVSNSGNTFTPDAITVMVGDTINFTIAAMHDVVEVDMAEYMSNGNTPLSGGFSLPFGGGQLIATAGMAGMHYYVCTPHAALGMKGTIDVQAPPPATGTPILTMLADGDCTGGNPKVAEIYADGTVDFSLFSLQNQTNANTTWGNTVSLAALGTLTDTYAYVYYESTVGIFATEFPSAVHFMASGTLNLNGDDRLRIINTATTAVIDQFGVSDLDGTGTTWETLDGYAYRVSGTGPDGAFVEANWTIVNDGLNGLGLCQGGASFGSITGSGTYTSTLLPQVYFKTDSFTYNEGDGVVQLDSLIINPAIASPLGQSFEVHLHASSTATVADFDITGLPIPITLPQTIPLSPLFNFSAQALEVTLVDDALIEGAEWVAIVLRNGMNGLTIGADSILYLKITDNDFPVDTFVALETMSATVNEGDGTYNIVLDYQQLGANANHTVDLALITGDAADIANYTTQTVTFSSVNQSVTITITDDAIVEGNDVLTFALINPTNGLLIGPDSIFTLTIENNDVPTFDLGLIDGNNATGGDSTGLHGKFIGIVNSPDRGFNSVEFSIQSATGSVDVFSSVAPFSTMAPAVGDEVEIEGDLTFFNGLVRIENLVSLTTLSTGNAIVPVVVDNIVDSLESTLVRINGLTLVDPAQWIAAGSSGFNVAALNVNGDTITIRIDRDYLNLYNSTAPNSAVIDVIGVASQFDATAPYDQFYQILPRDLDDIILYPTLNFNDQGAMADEADGTYEVNFTVANDNGGTYAVDVALTGGNGTADDIDNFVTITGVLVSGGTGSFTVNITDDATIEGNESFIFTLSNPQGGLLLGNGKNFELTIVDNDESAIENINVRALKLYPNPASETVVLDFVSNESQLGQFNWFAANGALVSSSNYTLVNGNNQVNFDISQFAKGVYTLEIQTEKGQHSITVLVK